MVCKRTTVCRDAAGDPQNHANVKRVGRTLLRDQDRRKEGIRLGRTDQHGAPGDGTHRKTRAPLHATQMDIQFGGTSVKLSQTNGVRQGGPDSPVVFSALVGDSLLKTQSRVTISAWGPNTKLPPPPHHTSGYMDDVYVWGENPKHVQQVVDILEKIFAEHGLYVNHKKTNAIANVGTHTPGADKGTRSCLDGPRLPVSFAGGPAILAAESCPPEHARPSLRIGRPSAPTPPWLVD